MNKMKEKILPILQKISKKLPPQLRQPLIWCMLGAVLVCTIAVTVTIFGHERDGGKDAYAGLANGHSCVMESAVASLYDNTADTLPITNADSPQVARTDTNVHASATAQTGALQNGASPSATSAAQNNAAPGANAAAGNNADAGNTAADDDSETIWNDVTQYLANAHEVPQGSAHVATTPVQTPVPSVIGTPDPLQPSTDINTPPQISYTEYTAPVSQKIILFSVSASDVTGTALTENAVAVTCNNVPYTPVYTKQNVMTYAISLQAGANTVGVTATSAVGAVNSITQSIVYEPPAENTVIVSVEATTVGLGYVIAPTSVTIEEGKPISYYVDKVLNEQGFASTITGTVESDYYLASIQKAGAFANPQIPADLKAKILSEPDTNYVASFNEMNYSPDALSAFNFTSQSGWMYCVNDQYYNVGMSYLTPNADDVIRVRFSLASGRDIGDGINGSNWEKQW